MFVGQEHILKELDIVLPEVFKGNKKVFLFRGESGCGKTTLAFKCMNAIKKYTGQNYSYLLGDKIGFSDTINNYIIDEIHLCDKPEVLYPVLDQGRYNIIFCTNEAAILKEPLVNRCDAFYFVPYTKEQILYLLRNKLHFRLSTEMEEILWECTLNNPRITVHLASRLNVIVRAMGTPKTEEDLTLILKTVLSIENGYYEIHRRYLSYMQHVKRASLDSISNAIRLDKDTIKREVEPILILRNRVRISSKGREYVEYG